MFSTGVAKPLRRIAGTRKAKALKKACCCVLTREEINRPIPMVENRDTNKASARISRGRSGDTRNCWNVPDSFSRAMERDARTRAMLLVRIPTSPGTLLQTESRFGLNQARDTSATEAAPARLLPEGPGESADGSRRISSLCNLGH